MERMKRILIFWAMMVAAMGAAAIGAPDSQLGNDVGQAKALASRLSPALAAKVEFHQIDAEQGRDVFTLESRGGKVAGRQGRHRGQ